MKISDLKYIWNRLLLTRKVNRLNIEFSGVDNEGYAYVKLKDDYIFYGFQSNLRNQKYYNLLSRKTKARLCFAAFQVANDIAIRYIEGGLKLGGPAKELHYSVKKKDIIAEMGAYMGYYTLYLSKKAGNEGKVIAIEPIPDNLQILRKNIHANRIKNVTIIPQGVWKKKTQMSFQRKSGDNQSGSIDLTYKKSTVLHINVDSLDNILTNCNIHKVDFMLIQLNGAEPEALEGLYKFHPNNFAIAARYSKGKISAAKHIADLLHQRGYSCKIEQNDFVFAKSLS